MNRKMNELYHFKVLYGSYYIILDRGIHLDMVKSRSSFLLGTMSRLVCIFVPFRLSIVLSVLRMTASYDVFGIFKHFLHFFKHGGCLMRGRNCLPFPDAQVLLLFLVGARVAHHLVFCVVFFDFFIFVLCFLYQLFPTSLDFQHDCRFGFL